MTEYPVPAVRIIVADESGRVLILKRAETEYAPGQWCLPGGKVDYGVTVEQAARRELKEETALECTDAQFLFYQDSLPLEPGKMHAINLYFECTAKGTVTLNEESTDSTWIGPAALEDYSLVFRNDLALRQYWGLDSVIRKNRESREDD